MSDTGEATQKGAPRGSGYQRNEADWYVEPRSAVHALLDAHGLDYALDWTLGGVPFLTAPGALSQALQDAIAAETGVTAELSTSGGTSDGRFIAQVCPQVVEFGPCNASIHKVDESIEVGPLALFLRLLHRHSPSSTFHRENRCNILISGQYESSSQPPKA